MTSAPQTWHYGVIAKWWAEFNRDGPEIEYFRSFVETGQPALDVGCGTGRLLVPYVRAGLDVDGCDVSADMIALCRAAAAREGLAPTLFVQPVHALDPPRRYRTIYVCGAFGVGSTRDRDCLALRRFHDALEPGGTLVLDNEAPYANAHQWPYWSAEARAALPEGWPAEGTRRRAADGTELDLRSRVLDLDPLTQHVRLEMLAEEWHAGELVTSEQRTVDLGLYFTNELVLMLEHAGFVDVDVRAGYTGGQPTSDDDFVVLSARRP
jgi:SAM-dependent methyltransferase